MAYRVTGHREAAEDVVQETFTRLLPRPPAHPLPVSPRVYLISLVHQRASEHVRREVLGWKLALRYPINPLFFGGLTYRGLRNLSAYWWRRALARPSRPLEPLELLEPSPARQAD